MPDPNEQQPSIQDVLRAILSGDAEASKLEDMASDIISGGFAPDPGTPEEQIDGMPGTQTVTLECEAPGFKAQALALHLMPGMRVLSTMIAPEPMKMMQMMEMFLMALEGDKARDDLDMLSWSELNSVVAQWIRKSQELKIEEMTKKRILNGDDPDAEGAWD